MKFEDLSNKDKAMYTYNQIQNKRVSVTKGKKEAALYSFQNACKIRNKLKGKKKVCIRR